jgi:hypothetical protein
LLKKKKNQLLLKFRFLRTLGRSVDTERGVNQYQVQFKNLFQLILKPFNYIQ